MKYLCLICAENLEEQMTDELTDLNQAILITALISAQILALLK
jgi:hypothetical protein